ncbi:MAG: ferritin-like domain-containing protein [Myxococcota bacterium]
MNTREFSFDSNAPVSRRSFLGGATSATLSAAAIGLLAGAPSLVSRSARAETGEQDIRILNTALAAEHEAVAAYQVGAGSGLLRKPALDLAVRFKGQHEEHVDLLAATVSKLGGAPTGAKASYTFPVASLKNEEDVLRFAAGLEKGAVSAYLGAVPILGSGELARAAASILGDEAMHWAVLRYVLGDDPVPHAFVS